MNIDVNGEKFVVSVSYGAEAETSAPTATPAAEQTPTFAPALLSNGEYKEILAASSF